MSCKTISNASLRYRTEGWLRASRCFAQSSGIFFLPLEARCNLIIKASSSRTLPFCILTPEQKKTHPDKIEDG